MAARRARKSSTANVGFPGMAELLRTIENNFRALAMMIPGAPAVRRKPTRRRPAAPKRTVRKVARKARKVAKKVAPKRRPRAALRRALRAAPPL